jgi:polyisoprenyl-phosphate glycosyltransferase
MTLNEHTPKKDAIPVLSIVFQFLTKKRDYKVLSSLLDVLDRPYEIVVMDNGSSDNTESIMLEIASKNPHWHCARLSRNFGYQNSITCGVSVVQGGAIVVIDRLLEGS